MSVNTIEISSYPKSGNTWLRNLIASYLVRLTRSGERVAEKETVNHFIPRIQQDETLTRKDLPICTINGNEFRFYKSHITGNPRFDPDRIVYIHRHPLDVFLSVLNYKHITGKLASSSVEENRSVEEIAEDGDLDSYFRRFLEDLGGSLFHPMLGDDSRIDNHITVLDRKNVLALKYEMLLEERESYFERIIGELFGEANEAALDGLFDAVDDKTKNSGGPFFWKGKSGTRFDFLSDDQIAEFTEEHSALLEKLGYL